MSEKNSLPRMEMLYRLTPLRTSISFERKSPSTRLASIFGQEKANPIFSNGVEVASLKVVEVFPGDSPTPVPIHLANHGLAIGVPNRGLTQVNHRSLKGVAVDFI